MRRNRKIDPTVAADLEALDATLAGEREDRELSLIVDEVRASAPRMSPAFAARLDAAAANGFAGPEPAPRPKASWRPTLGPALGVATAGVFALVIGVAALNGNGTDSKDASPSGAAVSKSAAPAEGGGSAAVQGDQAAPSAQAENVVPGTPRPLPQSSAAAPSTASGGASEDSAPSGQAELDRSSAVGVDSSTAVPPPGAGPRRVQRAAALTISTPIGKLQDTADGVAGVADRLGGYVYNSDVSADGENGQATFDLRIPTDRLDESMAALSRLGHVRSRTETSKDITARFSSTLSRLHDARSERQALLRALADADTEQEIDSIRLRLSIARQQIVAAKNELVATRRASNLARVGVTVLGVQGGQGATTGDGKSWAPGQAVHDALRVLSVAAGVLIVGLAGAIPAILVLGALFLAWRATRRRRRELALDATPGPAV